MSLSISELEQIETQVRNWPPARRAEFAERLLESVDREPSADEPNLSWIQVTRWSCSVGWTKWIAVLA